MLVAELLRENVLGMYTRLEICSRPLDIVYNPNFIKRFKQFFQLSDSIDNKRDLELAGKWKSFNSDIHKSLSTCYVLFE